MAYELIYTSAPAGIRQGSTGFCVVACTKGIGPRLMMTLEALSAYKPLYPHYAENAWDNPISRAHFISTVNGAVQHILSRVCFNGVDHTGRSNKLASHVVLSSAEAAAAVGGPGALLLREELFKDASWEIQTQYFDRQLQIPATGIAPVRCNTWEAVTGDAGWGGFLARSFMDNPSRNVYISYRPEQQSQMMMLIQEALNLLPPAKRWEVTFNTYFVNLPAGMSCTWRCCPVGSEALLAARRSPANIVIDISAPQELTATGDLIDVARSGILPQTAETVPVSAPPPVLTVPDEPPEEEEEVFQDTPAESCQFQENFQRTAASQPYRQQSEYAAEPPVVYHRRSQKPLFMAIALVAVLLLLICGGVYLLVFSLNSNSETPAAVKTAAVPPQVKNDNSDTETANNNQSDHASGTESASEPTPGKNDNSDTEIANNNQPAPAPVPEIPELDPRYSWEYNSETLKENKDPKLEIPLGSGVKMVKIRTFGTDETGGTDPVELTPENNKTSFEVGDPNYGDKYVCTLTKGILTIEKTKGSTELKMELELQFQGKNGFILCPLYFKPGISYFRLGKPQADTSANTITVEIKKAPANFTFDKEITVKPAKANRIECDGKKITLTFNRAESANEKRLDYLRYSEGNIISQKNENIYKFVVSAKVNEKELNAYKDNCKDLIADIGKVCKDIKSIADTDHTLKNKIDEETKEKKDERLLFDKIAGWIGEIKKTKTKTKTKTAYINEWSNINKWLRKYDNVRKFADKYWKTVKVQTPYNGYNDRNDYNEIQTKIQTYKTYVENEKKTVDPRLKKNYTLFYNGQEAGIIKLK